MNWPVTIFESDDSDDPLATDDESDSDSDNGARYCLITTPIKTFHN